MAGENPISFILDLDTDAFKSGIESSISLTKQLGQKENLAGLIEGLEVTVEVLGAVGLAAAAFKGALDLTVEAENITRVNELFGTLTEQAGISTETLRSGLEKASNGLVPMTELLQSVNKVIVEMGASAAKTPELFELSRKAAILFGGTAKQAFDTITQAIAGGYTRSLQRSYGLQIDVNEAVKKFAAQQGLAADEVNKAGRSQAILNAFLEKAGHDWAGVNSNQKTTVNLIEQTKTALKELGEVFTLVFEKTGGPMVRKMVSAFKDLADGVHHVALRVFGSDLEKNNEKLIVAKQRVEEFTRALNSERQALGQANEEGNKSRAEEHAKRVQLWTQRIKEQQIEIDKLEAKQENADHKQTEREKRHGSGQGGGGGAGHFSDKDKVKKNEEETQAEIFKIDEKARLERMKQINSIEELDKAVKENQQAREKQHQIALQKIENDSSKNHTQKVRLEEAENKRYQDEVRNSEKETWKLRQQLLDDYVANSENALQGVGRAAHRMAEQAAHDLKDFGKQGDVIMNNFAKNSTSAFEQIGVAVAANKNVAQSTADAMKGFFLNMIGDTAEQYGGMLLLEGIGSFDPVAIAAGGALIAFGAGVKSMASQYGAGGGGSSVSTAGISSGGGGPSGPDLSAQQTGGNSQQSLSQQQVPQRTVNINIAGHYLNTQESQRTLMEAVRNETDATDFQYNKIGV